MFKNPSIDNPTDPSEMEQVLEYTSRDCCLLDRAMAIRMPHWAQSGLIPRGQFREIEVGRRAELIFRVGPVTRTWALTRRPAGSQATLTGGALVADLAGVYVVRLVIGVLSADVTLVAIPRELIARIAAANSTTDPWKKCRGSLNDGSWTAAALADALENNKWGRLASPS